jgi:tetratricopeptide (TPR) repeat protein
MKRTVRLGSIAGADIRVHWSILLLAAFILRPVFGLGWLWLLLGIAIVILLFGCILLHELAHVIVARHFGIRTRSVILWPLGGLAIFSRPPDRPWHDILISGAGPLLNAAVWALALGLDAVLRQAIDWSYPAWPAALVPLFFARQQLGVLAEVNGILAVFNLIPAYPLDGGRMLKAALTAMIGPRRAVRVALAVSLVLAAALGAYAAIHGDWLLAVSAVLIGVFAATLNPQASKPITLALNWLLNRGDYYLQRGDHQAAIAQYDRRLRRNPQDAGAYHNRAAAYEGLHIYEQALEDYTTALRLNPDSVKALLDRARLYMELGDDDRALADAESVVRHAPALAWAYSLRGYIHLAREAIDAATADFEQALALAPGEAASYNNRGYMAFLHGEMLAARRDYDAALRLDDQLVFAYTNRARLFQHLGDYDAAFADLQSAMAVDPEDSDLYFHRGAVWFARGDAARGLADADQMLALAPQDALLHDERWLREYVRGNLAWAVACYRHTIARRPTDALAHAGLGDAFRINGDLASALAAYDQAAALAPDAAAIVLRRAWAHAAATDAAAATADARRVLDLSADLRLRWRAAALLRKIDTGSPEADVSILADISRRDVEEMV